MANQELIVKLFEGNKVKFNIVGYITATFIAKKYGKKANDWLRLD